ncbi:hypothetical protein MTBBW1_80120 [Desulfamplus magnetovallimortis]|uniref:Uncharacterized protein n=1 Tax=Desulfamplus magnetovallimortis TaxID=1246637 RepID=L0R6X4_9BACT|nr:hypothetical protein [Desulfamplus magnetovallimortis]CCO06726.1 hypothetical protein DEMABW1_80120 [Desulfamplus magnetovallimortis BW-1]SLM32777.1 hypothetical protein MTBBW1_80120 [Desulfamplus magnetovallimortis]
MTGKSLQADGTLKQSKSSLKQNKNFSGQDNYNPKDKLQTRDYKDLKKIRTRLKIQNEFNKKKLKSFPKS